MMHHIRYIAIFCLLFLTYGYQTEATLDGHINYRIYGHIFETPLNKDISAIKIGRLNQKEFNQLTSLARGLALDKTSNSLLKSAVQYNLDALGTVIFVKKFSQYVYPSVELKNEAIFLQYLLLKQMGFDVLLTRTGDDLNCLGNLSFTLGNFIYIHYANRVYVDLDFDKKSNSGEQHLIFQDQAKTYKTITRNILNPVKFNALTSSRDINIQYRGTDYHFTAISNESYIQYLSDLPMFNLGRDYSRMPFSRTMKNSLLETLRIITSDMTTVEATKFLLHFVQNIVPYGDDYSKYGGERYYFPEETIMSKNADCEDKAFLLAYLVRDLLGLESVGLYFKEDKHISIAINIPNYNHPNELKYKGITYIPCEPTGKNARLGYSGIDLKRVTEVIPF